MSQLTLAMTRLYLTLVPPPDGATATNAATCPAGC